MLRRLLLEREKKFETTLDVIVSGGGANKPVLVLTAGRQKVQGVWFMGQEKGGGEKNRQLVG